MLRRYTQGGGAGSTSASSIVNVPAGNISSTNVQAAINELDTEKVAANVAITAGTNTKITYDAKGLVTAGAAATAADIVFTPADSIASTTTQNAIVEALVDARAYADAVAAGLGPKAAVDAATFAPLPANTRTSNTLTADADGTLPNIDTSYVPSAGKRVLVKNEVLAANNGIYVIDSVGSPSTRWSMTRSTDADDAPSSGEVKTGMYTVAVFGAHAGQGWVLLTPDPITLNATSLTFSPFAVYSLDSQYAINTPAGNIVATTTQAAINELDTEKVAANTAITGATNTKITYDAKGLVTAGAAATAADIVFTPADTIASTNVQNAIVEALTDARAYADLVSSTVGTSKASVKVVTEWALPANTVVGNVMTANANGALPTIDSRTMAVGERVLVAKEGGPETPHVNNGWYDVTDLGSAGTPWVLTRSIDGVQGQVVPGSLLYVEHGDSGEDISGYDIVMNQVATSTNPADPQYAALRVGDTMVDCLLCNGNTVAQRVVTVDGTLPVTPTIGYRYAALGPGSYARRPQLRGAGVIVAPDTNPNDVCWAGLLAGDIIFGCQAASRVYKCTTNGVFGGGIASPTGGIAYCILRPAVGVSTHKLVGPSQGTCFVMAGAMQTYNEQWCDFRGSPDMTLSWGSGPGDMWMYLGNYAGRFPEASNMSVGDRVLYFQRQKATAGRRLWVLATPEPITVGTTPLLFKPVAYS